MRQVMFVIAMAMTIATTMPAFAAGGGGGGGTDNPMPAAQSYTAASNGE